MTRDMRGPRPRGLPSWVPQAARHYLAHTEQGAPIRELARQANVHASTILRQVRRFEGRRDDPLIDDALRALAQPGGAPTGDEGEHRVKMDRDDSAAGGPISADHIAREGARILRRLTEPGAVLAVARDMEMGVVVRDQPDGPPQRTAVVDRAIAQAMALKEWIACADPQARVARYHITALGRQELRRQLAEDSGPGFAEARTAFQGAQEVDDRIRHMRSVLGESPMAALARRRDKGGEPFLSRDLVAAGERLREDFELSQVGPRVAQDWDQFLTGRVVAGPGASERDRGASAARARVAAALTDLGPGLGDVALRCCCYLEGLETLERRMNWSARSGKIVLRIALQRLKRHYEETGGKFGPLIG